MEDHCQATDGAMIKDTTKLIAPCGLNCLLCRAYMRDKKACHGCRGDDRFKSKTCRTCPIKNCEKMKSGDLQFCIDCVQFPCAQISRLEKRYTTNYGVSVFNNLIKIKNSGVATFVKDENRKWICPKCGAILCMHKGQCISCGYVWRAQNRIE
jgi:ribosomal protein L40E